LLLKVSCETVEPFVPEPLVFAEPFDGVLHRRRAEPAGDGASGLLPRDKASICQHVEVLHDGRQRHRKRLCEFADRNRVLKFQLRQQRAPGRV
jgi:hypothetical protein